MADVDGQAPTEQGENEGRLGPEVQVAVVAVDKERLLAEPIAGKKDGSAQLVYRGQGPHALAAVEPFDAVPADRPEQHLGVARGAEALPPLDEVLLDLDVVVQLTV